MPRGGARPGAGRKPKSELYGPKVRAAERLIAADLQDLVQTLRRLAHGGYERVESVRQPAGTVFVDDWEDVVVEEQVPSAEEEGPDGETIYVTVKRKTGGQKRVRRLAFPDLPADEMVTVSQRVSVADGDRTALMYLIDRVMGKPVDEPEPDSEELRIAALREALVRVLETTSPEVAARVCGAVDDLLNHYRAAGRPDALPPG